MSEELRVVITRLADWMANFSSPWSAYWALMDCCLVALDKSPWVRPVGIGETLFRELSKLVMRSAGDQAKTACVNLQLCAGLEARIESATHAVRQKRMERARHRRSAEEAIRPNEEEEKDEAAVEERLMVETEGTEGEAAEILEEALGIKVKEESEGEEVG